MRTLIFSLLCTGLLSAQPTWSTLPNVYSNENGQRYDDVFFLNENIGWAANGYYARVLKTIDGGQTWNEQISNEAQGTNYYFRNIEFLNENIGFLGTLNNAFLKTSDGGSTWNEVTNLPISIPAICGLDAVGSGTIYGCGAYFSPAYIIKSTDSGETWEYIDMSAYADALVEILFIDENIGYVSGNSVNGGVILKTVDGGSTWAEIYNSNIEGEYVWKLQVLDGQHMFGAVESVAPLTGKLIKSADGGVTWVSKPAPEQMIQAVGFISENHGWMGGHSTGFHETLDGGDTWNSLDIGSNLNRIFILDNGLAYASGTSIYKFDVSLSTGGSLEKDREPLHVIVVNPVKNVLELQIDFKGSDHIVLGLYSSTGQFIKTLKLDHIGGTSTRNYHLDFPFAAGAYFIDMHTNTGRQTIKIVKN